MARTHEGVCVDQSQNPAVLAYRLERLRRAPRSWLYCVAVFTAVNGIMLSLSRDWMILAGLVAPCSAPLAETRFLVEFQQNMKSLPISVLVIEATSNRLEHLRPLVPAILGALAEIAPKGLRKVGA